MPESKGFLHIELYRPIISRYVIFSGVHIVSYGIDPTVELTVMEPNPDRHNNAVEFGTRLRQACEEEYTLDHATLHFLTEPAQAENAMFCFCERAFTGQLPQVVQVVLPLLNEDLNSPDSFWMPIVQAALTTNERSITQCFFLLEMFSMID